MAPAPSRVAPSLGDSFIATAGNTTPREQPATPDWIKRLPLRVQRAWGISRLSLPGMLPPPAYVYHRRARSLAFARPPTHPPPQPRLQRSPWQENLSSIAHSDCLARHQASSFDHQASAHPQAPLRDQAGFRGRDDHGHTFPLNQAHHDDHAESGPFYPQSPAQDFFPLSPPPPSPPRYESPPPYPPYDEPYPAFIPHGDTEIPSDVIIDCLEKLVNVFLPFLSLRGRDGLRDSTNHFLDVFLLGHLGSDSTDEWSESEDICPPSLPSSLVVGADDPAEVDTIASFASEHSSSPSTASLSVDEQVDFVDQSVTFIADPTPTEERSSSPSSPVEPKRRVRQRVRNNKKKGRKVRARKLARKMAERTAANNTPVPLEGATGIKAPSIAGTTIMASDADTVRSPSLYPVPLPISQGMYPLPTAPATVPEVAPSKKKRKKKGKKKKGNRRAPQAGGDNAGVSVDAQSTDLAPPTLESGDFIEGVPSEVEIPAGVTTGQYGPPCASKAPSLTVVGDVETSMKPTPSKEAYVGPCIVDTESWRQRMLARQQEAEAKREAGFLASTSRAGGVFSYSGNQSENGWAQMPMRGHPTATQFSQGGGHQVGYAMPRSGALARAGCTWKPRCCQHYQGSQSHSCCCLHGAVDCWLESDVTPNADYHLPAPLPADTQEPAPMSQVSSPKSSSLGEPVSEPIAESVVSVFAFANTVKSLDLVSPVQPTTAPEVAPVMSISTPANIMATLQAHLGENLTGEDVKSPSLYFDAKSKNPSSSPLASEKSNDASTSDSLMLEGEAQWASSAADSPETRNQGYQAGAADQTEATGPLAFQSEHVRALFGNPEFADIQLLLSPGMSHPPIVYHLHKAIIASSTFLYNVMAAKLCREGWVDHVRVFTGVSFTCSHGVTMALQVLYGTPLVTNDNLRKVTLEGLNVSDDNKNSSFSFSVERAMVDFALCYAATGALLARREITERGIDMAISHLSWDTAEFLLSFGMTPLAYMVTCPDVPFPPISPPTSRASSLSGGNGSGTPVIGLDHFHDFHYVQANRALNAALRFITNAVTPDFDLYRHAQAHYTPSRIPPTLHALPGSNLSNPRLEEICFGSLPSFADLRPTDPAILVPSAMLITLPYRVFTIAIDLIKAGGNFNPELITEVVDERESRRLNALRVSLIVDPRRVPLEAFTELQYQELVKVEESGEPTDDNNHLRALRTTVDRVWVGADMPNATLLRPCRVATATPGPGPGRTFGPGTTSVSNA